MRLHEPKKQTRQPGLVLCTAHAGLKFLTIRPFSPLQGAHHAFKAALIRLASQQDLVDRGDELGVRRDLRRGLATLCVGGGMGIATVIERV